MKSSRTLTAERVPLAYVAALLDLAESLGASREQLLTDAGIDARLLGSPSGRMSFVDFRLLASTVLLGCQEPALGLLLGQRLNVSTHGILGYAVLASANLGDALRFALTYYRVLGLAFELELVEVGDTVEVRAIETLPLGPLGRFAAECLMASLHGIAAFLLGEPLLRARLGFMHAAPEYVGRYAQVFAAPVLFEQPYHFFGLPKRYLERPMALANPATVQMCEQQCEALLVSLDLPDGLLTRLRRLLLARPGDFPDMDSAARALHTSSRTLRRQLAQLGASYQGVRDEVRRRLAVQYLGSTQLPLFEIAALLGFSDASNFRRAFKKWTGKSPGDFRAE